MVWIILSSIFMYVIGFIIGAYPRRKTPVGTLRIDRSDPDDSPYLFLELEVDPSDLMKEKKVVLKVNHESYISQE